MSPERTVWVVGGIAWDTVLHVPEHPRTGGYVRGSRRIERQGGSAGNVALALATTGIRCGFATALGDDEHGRALEDALRASGLVDVRIDRSAGETEHVLVVVDAHGDRTLYGLAHPGPATSALRSIDLAPGDIVVFVVWEEPYLDDLVAARAAGCTVVVGIHALLDPRVPGADIAIGSRSDLPTGFAVEQHLDRFPHIVLTAGAEGAWQFEHDTVIHQPACPAQPVDSTGAGDAFLAGYLVALARDLPDPRTGLLIGTRWAAAAIERETSVPPPWSSVPDLDVLLSDASEDGASHPPT